MLTAWPFSGDDTVGRDSAGHLPVSWTSFPLSRLISFFSPWTNTILFGIVDSTNWKFWK